MAVEFPDTFPSPHLPAVPEVEAVTHQLIVGMSFNSLSSQSQASPIGMHGFLVGRVVISSMATRSTTCQLKYRIEKGSMLQRRLILIQVTFE